jgi:hypothetical protein
MLTRLAQKPGYEFDSRIIKANRRLANSRADPVRHKNNFSTKVLRQQSQYCEENMKLTKERVC